jgi:hypothetical protein
MRDFMQQPEFDPTDYVHEHDELAALGPDWTYLATHDVYKRPVRRRWNAELERAEEMGVALPISRFKFWDVLLYPVQALSDVEGAARSKSSIEPARRQTHPATASPTVKQIVGAAAFPTSEFLGDRGSRRDTSGPPGRRRTVALSAICRKEKDRSCRAAFRAILEEDDEQCSRTRRPCLMCETRSSQKFAQIQRMRSAGRNLFLLIDPIDAAAG